MVFKKYIRRGGKTYGPYLYENKRVNGKVVTRYVGPAKKENSDKKSRVIRTNTVDKSYHIPSIPSRNVRRIALLLLILVVGFFLFGFTGKTVFVDERYSLSDSLYGELGVVIDPGNSIQKDSVVEIVLSKDGVVLAEQSMSIENFIGSQGDYVEVNTSEQNCISQTF